MKKLLVLLLAIALLITGCTSGTTPEPTDTETPTPGNTEDPVVETPQEYSMAYSGEVTTINYLVTASTNEFGLAANLVDTLIDYDQYGVAQPALATEWTTSEDGLVWTFKIREGVKWVDYTGKEYADVTAHDFVDAMAYILDSTNESKTANIAYGVLKNAQAYYDGEITDFAEVGVKALDNNTLEYTLERQTPYFESMLAYVCFFPANGQFLEEVGDRFGTDNENFLYNGSYVMETFEPQNRRVLVKNESYWDKENVHITKLNYLYNKEASTLAPELFARGEIDFAAIPSNIIDQWMGNPQRADMVRPNRTSFYTFFYIFNFDPKFEAEYEPDNWKVAVNNVNFRKAMFHGLDRRAAMLTAEPYNPDYKLSNTITPKNFVNFEGVDYTLLDGLADITDRNSFNAELAKEFKEKAMEELAGEATFPIKVLMPYNSGSTEWANRAQVVEQQMERLLGTDFIDIIIEAKPPTGFLQDVRRSGNYAFLEANWGPDYADPETYTDPFAPTGTYNWPHLAEGYEEANGKNTYENMVNAAKEEVLDMEKRYILFAEAEAFLIDEAFVIPYALGGGGYSASKLSPFDSPYSPFGVSSERFKGQKVLDKPMNSEEFTEGLAKWEAERAEALKNAK